MKGKVITSFSIILVDEMIGRFQLRSEKMMFMGPYVPDKILRAVAAYVHRRNLHPSTSQTAKEFKAYYYPLSLTLDRLILIFSVFTFTLN